MKKPQCTRAGVSRSAGTQCSRERAEKNLGPLALRAPTKREQVAALVCAPDDPWWEARLLHTKLYPVRDRAVS